MPKKGSKNDHVSLVRSRLPQIANLSREKIELALLYYDSDVDATVQAFERDGAIDALSGWTEMTHDRGNNGSKRTNGNSPRKISSSSSSTPSNGLLRPSQRVSNLFQTFADTGVPTVLPSSPRSQTDDTPRSESNVNSSSEISNPPENVQTTEKPVEPPTNGIEKNSPTVPKTLFSDNRKSLTKSAKDLQRQTSTLSNVENSFENEMKSSVKRIADVFKELREILKDREVQLYLEMDKAREQGLAVIRRRQERASELRQRMDQCDRLEASEIDHLRTDIKQFVTDRRYDLGEELTSSHRFEYDPSIIEALKHFGTVLRLERTRTNSNANEINGGNSTEFTAIPTTPTTENSFVEQQNQTQQYHNGHNAGDFHSTYPLTPTNGYHHRRRTAPPTQNYFQYHNGGNHARRVRPQQRTSNHSNSEKPIKSRRPPPIVDEQTVIE